MRAPYSARRSNRLVAIRVPTRREARDGAEIVFERFHNGHAEVICAARCYESWQQWGASGDALSANIKLVESWRRGDIRDFMPKEDPS